MRPKSMVLILIALGCGLIASIGISQVVERNSGDGNEDVATEPIFVAMVDMGIGDPLDANSVKLEEWPVDKIPEGAVTDAAQLEGMSPNQRLFEGEPILMGKLADQESLRQSSQTIKKGFRVVSVKVDMASSVSYLITPGDRVDVIGSAGSRAEVILDNIEVFAINSKVSREVDTETGGSIQAKTVSLLVTPDQAIILNAHPGRISLLLRHPDDDSGNTMGAEPVDEPMVSAPSQPSMPFFEPSFDEPQRSADSFVMEVMEGGSSETVRRYTWDDGQELPREIGNTAGEAMVGADVEEAAEDFPFPEGPSGDDEADEGGESEEAENAPSRYTNSFRNR